MFPKIFGIGCMGADPVIGSKQIEKKRVATLKLSYY